MGNMSNYKIESGVPLPKYAKGKIGSTINYPLKDLKVTQSFITEEPYDKKHTNKVRARLNLIRSRAGLANMNFSVGPNVDRNGERIVEEGNKTRIRVWRTK